MEIQLALGADIVMAFDQCAAYGAEPGEVERAVERTTALAGALPRRLRRAQRTRTAGERVLFGIMQGGVDEALRRRSAAEITACDLPGYAIGGLSVGEPTAALREMTELAAGLLPADRPRYLMGVGLSRRHPGRGGCGRGHVRLRAADAHGPHRHRADPRRPAGGQEPGATPRTARPWTPNAAARSAPATAAAYLRHLFQAREILGPTLATIHNLHFYQELMAGIRAAIAADCYADHARTVRRALAGGGAAPPGRSPGPGRLIRPALPHPAA